LKSKFHITKIPPEYGGQINIFVFKSIKKVNFFFFGFFNLYPKIEIKFYYSQLLLDVMRDIIEDELFSSSVIKDLHALDFDFLPEELPHRTEQLRKLAQMFKPLLSGISQNAVVRGPVGTGKTVITKKFCNSLVSIARKQAKIIEYVHINCRKRSTDSMVLIGVLNHFDKRFPDRGFSVQEMLPILHKQLERREAQMLLVLDEGDVGCTPRFERGQQRLVGEAGIDANRGHLTQACLNAI
jgi:hypothetical protein